MVSSMETQGTATSVNGGIRFSCMKGNSLMDGTLSSGNEYEYKAGAMAAVTQANVGDPDRLTSW